MLGPGWNHLIYDFAGCQAGRSVAEGAHFPAVHEHDYLELGWARELYGLGHPQWESGDPADPRKSGKAPLL